MSILGPDCADARPAARPLSQKLSACAGRQDDRLLRRRLQPRVLSEAVWCKSSLRCRACDENCCFTFSLSRCRAQTRCLDALRKRDAYIRGLPIVTYAVSKTRGNEFACLRSAPRPMHLHTQAFFARARIFICSSSSPVYWVHRLAMVQAMPYSTSEDFVSTASFELLLPLSSSRVHTERHVMAPGSPLRPS